MPEYELFTHRGSLLAARLVGGIADGVASGALTRAQAVEAACAAISDIRSIDAGMRDSEPMWAIASELSRAFGGAGMARIDGDELNHAHWIWARNGGEGRPEADGNRHFADTSWYDPERAAFHDACEAVDAVRGSMNTASYHARMPGSGCPAARFRPSASEDDVVVSALPDGTLGVTLPAGVADMFEGTPADWAGDRALRASQSRLVAFEAVKGILAAVESANSALARLGGTVELADLEGRQGPELGVRWRGQLSDAGRPRFPSPEAGPSLDERRAAALEAVSSSFDFGAVVEDMSGWRHDEPGAEYTRRVFVQDADDPEADSVRGTLTVVFEPWSDTVAEVRASVGGVDVETRPAPEPGR